MREAYRILPVYTGDVSGVCSALYELGGMVVIHDPSGCNSTYNTHDETRWYEKDSLIFITGLSHTDAVMGNDEKFYRETYEAAMELKPRFIALVNSPIPYLNSTDMKGIAAGLEQATGIPAFYVQVNGMHDYVYGASKALAVYTSKLLSLSPAPSQVNKSSAPGGSTQLQDSAFLRVNLLGVTPLDFAWERSYEKLAGELASYRIEVNTIWSMGCEPEDFCKITDADVNLVVSSTGLKMAEILRDQLGMPFVIGTPLGSFTEEIARMLHEAKGKNAAKFSDTEALVSRMNHERESLTNIYDVRDESLVWLVGEPVTMYSMARCIEKDQGMRCRVLCTVEADQSLGGLWERQTLSEEEAEQVLKAADIVYADPLYEAVLAEHTHFFALPHLAFSGRMWLFSEDM